MGEFGLPADASAWVALIVALLWVGIFARSRRWNECVGWCERHFRTALAILAAIAALGTLAYFVHFLRGGPRIVDATAYLQQAKVFASGALTAPAFEPSSATRGRFVYFEPLRGTTAVLFPPGYPALLALGCLAGAPWLVGTLIAALLVWSTACLALRVFERKDAGVLAGLFSATTLALRYHTADTMSHGLSALLVTVALTGVLGAGLVNGVGSGLAIGWLLATRPVTGTAILAVAAIYRSGYARQRSWLVACALGLVPGITLWFAYQWASTGSPWRATQLAYYTVADGPPGCFRYGFGKGIGCLFEHGEYVARRLPKGFGIPEAAYVTLLRLRWHCLDVHNFEPLIAALVVAAARGVSRRRSGLLVAAVAATILGYVPFYFDGSYPGGGARLFADIIPLEHALVAGWLVTTAWSKWFIPLSLAGFATHGSFEHLKLQRRDGGRPMFEPATLEAAGIQRGLVFVDTDHGFFLGHNPAFHDARRGIVVLREHGDAHDRVAWKALGRPAAYRYHFDPTAREAQPTILPVLANELELLQRFEAESQWPVLEAASGWARPVFPPNDCSSGRRGLALEPTMDSAAVSVALHAEHAGTYRMRLGMVARSTGRQRITVKLTGPQLHGTEFTQGYDTARTIERNALQHECFDAAIDDIELYAGEQPMRIETNALGIVLDYWELKLVSAAPPLP